MKSIAGRFDHTVSGLTHSQLVLILLGVVVILGWVDYLTGFEITFSFIYLFPISIATWYQGPRWGYGFTVGSILVWMASNQLAGEQLSSDAVRYWNAGIRLVSFSLVVPVIGHLKETIETITHLARIDPLTGILNAREFYRQADLELARMGRFHHPVTVAFIDLDNFKAINDRLGHRTGDEMLRKVARGIESNLRPYDIFGRMGGDEFAILFPETDQEGAGAIVRKLQANLLTIMDELDCSTTFSLGAVTYQTPALTILEMLHQADAIMYSVKTHGKNGFIIHNANEGSIPASPP